jgi:hypothetical protein
MPIHALTAMYWCAVGRTTPAFSLVIYFARLAASLLLLLPHCCGQLHCLVLDQERLTLVVGCGGVPVSANWARVHLFFTIFESMAIFIATIFCEYGKHY